MREKELCVNQKIHIYLRKNPRFNIFGISFQCFYHRLVLGIVGHTSASSVSSASSTNKIHYTVVLLLVKHTHTPHNKPTGGALGVVFLTASLSRVKM